MNINVTVAYINYELRVIVFSNYRNNINIIYDKKICKFDLLSLNNDIEKDKLKETMEQTLEEITKKFKITNKKIDVVIDCDNHVESKQIIIVEFEQKKAITKSDLATINGKALSKSVAKDGLMYAGYLIDGYKIDGSSIVNPLGNIVHNKLEVYGVLKYININIYHLLKSLIEIADFKMNSINVGDVILKKTAKLTDNTGIIEICSRKTKFIINKDNEIKSFSTNIGLTNFFNNVYDQLIENHSPKDTEDAVRFLMKNFTFKKYDANFIVVGDITLNELINIFNNVVVNYFQYFEREFVNNKVNVGSYSILLNNYPARELVKLINLNLETKFDELIMDDFRNLDPIALKAALTVKKINKYRSWEI